MGVDFDRLREIDELFRVRWAPFTLAALEEKPLGFRELLRAMRASTGVNMNDTTLTRLTRRLISGGLIVRTFEWPLRGVYSLTPQGRAAVRLIASIVDYASLNHHQPGSGPDEQPEPEPDPSEAPA
jgi:DNA-binding HxlR family transcriptional regulator